MEVDFVLSNPVLAEHFGPIVRALLRRGVKTHLVVPPRPSRLAANRAWKTELHERCARAAKDTNTPYGTHMRVDADVAVTVLGAHFLHLYRHIKIKCRYGVGLLRSGYHYNAAMTRGFDGLLAHGAFEQRAFSRWFSPDRIKVMGIPRHDDSHLDRMTQPQALSRLSLDASRPVVVYFPTWAEHSGMGPFARGLAEVAKRYTLLVKPHALSRLAAQERRAHDPLERAGARLMADDCKFAHLIDAADLVVTDAKSGSTPEALLLTRQTPIITLTTRERSAFVDELFEIGPCLRDERQLLPTVEAELERDTHRHRRERVREQLFSDNLGHAADDAAEAILDLARIRKVSAVPSRLETLWPRPFRVARARFTTMERALATRATELRARVFAT